MDTKLFSRYERTRDLFFKLREEVIAQRGSREAAELLATEGEEDLYHSHHDLGLAEERMKYLELKVEAEKRERKDIYEHARVARLDTEELKVGLLKEAVL
ncbi:uncharacterized protein A4U43_C03F29240 [Asparagus officinalis]|uniref:Uncharacterized protein n=1 Tax=Asparagus officinalis TaxID=4686 RepID=A0A5P1FIS5_ASPOF|nr:uncharacterized protein A4U43_C03F29240 [Asparagus officinalis]